MFHGVCLPFKGHHLWRTTPWTFHPFPLLNSAGTGITNNSKKNWNEHAYLYDKDDDAASQEGDERVAAKATLSLSFAQTIVSSRSPDQVKAATRAIRWLCPHSSDSKLECRSYAIATEFLRCGGWCFLRSCLFPLSPCPWNLTALATQSSARIPLK